MLLPAQNEERNGVLQPLSWCSDGYFILACILETERCISCWSGMEVDESKIGIHKEGERLCVCLFVCCFLATECRILVPDQGLNHGPCIKSVEFQFTLEPNSQSLGTKFTLEVPLNCPLNIEWCGLRCSSTQPVFFQHRSKWLFFGRIPNKLTDLNTPCIRKLCL